MKTLLVNGCSFLAGDELVWDQFLKTIKRDHIVWQKACATDLAVFQSYRFFYRPRYNFASQLSDYLLTAGKVDLSDDGNSNDMIALKTIGFLLNKTPEERKNFHVCIGWSSVARLMKYADAPANCYVNLHVHHQEEKSHPMFIKLADYIRHTLVEAFDEDFAMNYVRNVLLLESFLKANDITYTFFRSLGTQHDFRKAEFDPFNEFHPFEKSATARLPKDKVSDPANWYGFIDDRDPTPRHPMYGISWCDSTILKIPNMLIPGNGHPTLEAVSDLVPKIGEFIKSQNVL